MSAPEGPEAVRTLGAALVARGWRVAVAESCTGGLVTKLLTDVPGSSAWTLGGVVAYADGVKTRTLAVSPELLRAHGAVSAEVAAAMARAVRTLTGAEVGAAVTGIAGPGGGVPGKPVGTVWFGVSTPDGSEVELRHFPGSRAEVRDAAAAHAIRLLVRVAGG